MQRAWNDSPKTKNGFTIVELLIVIVVIGILAAITIVAFNGVSNKARISVTQSDLNAASKQLANDNTTAGSFPSSLSSANGGNGVKSSTGTTYQYTYTASDNSYCLSATNGSNSYYVTSANPKPTSGLCPTSTSTFAAIAFTERAVTAGSGYYKAIATSSDGTKVALIKDGCVFTSTNSGATWSNCQRTPPDTDWGAIVMSSDGSKLLISERIDEELGGGHMYVSADFGATWLQRTGTIPNGKFAMSSDGMKLIASTYNPYSVNTSLYTSTDFGLTWTERTTAGSRAWGPTAISGDGTKLVAAVYPGNIYTSTDFGTTWTVRGSSASWADLAISNDGTKAVAVDQSPGYIYTSTDSGATWTQRTASTSGSWTSVSSSSDGTKLVAVKVNGSNGSLYTSTDAGITWVERTSTGSRVWNDTASSSTGATIYAQSTGSVGTNFIGVYN